MTTTRFPIRFSATPATSGGWRPIRVNTPMRCSAAPSVRTRAAASPETIPQARRHPRTAIMPETATATQTRIRVELRGRALWITIDREERRNAINKAVIAGIEAAMVARAIDPAIRAIVLTGAGRRRSARART